MATTSERSAAEVAREYFGSIRAGDTGPQERAYADDATITIQGVLEDAGKRELIAYFTSLWAAIPDFRFELLDVVAEDDRAAAHWRITGTFAGPGEFDGFLPTGARVDFRGVDYVTIRGGRIVRNDAYTDNMTVARQLGLLPPAGSTAEQRMKKLANARTGLAAKLGPTGPEQIAEGVWRVQGNPGRCTVYFVKDGDGVLMFDAGARVMTKAVGAAAARLGGLTRIVLGHGHTDHRGTAPAFDVPVLCHPDEVVDAEGSGGWRYWDPSLSFLPRWQRPLHKAFHAKLWDGGPVKISDTVSEDDDVAGFRVVHLPGHAPGLIALWRESDRLALCTDSFYTLDMLGRDDEPHVPLAGYNLDTEQARASLRKLAALEPAAAYPGHAEPVQGDPAEVRAKLEAAAAADAH
jgi:glyoxylase-like metal-dependent hydrolase (beta-lactamase superfamily II)/predicted ester cyclase